MILNKIELYNWRSYSSLNLSFDSKINAIEGKNGEGKTNIAEAIYYLSLTHSWRTNDNKDLLKSGTNECLIRAYVSEGELNRKIEIYLTKDSKRITLNGKPLRKLSEITEFVNVLLFSPEDTMLFVNSPSVRRNFLDLSISKIDSTYLSLISSYKHILNERNTILKKEKCDLTYLDVLTNQLLELEKPIIEKRNKYISSINKKITHLTKYLFGQNNVIKVVYSPFIKMNDNFIEEGKKLYKKSLESDIIHKSTSLGIHREDFSTYLNDKNIANYGSQGENRLTAIALKLCPYYLIDEENKKPIIVLDDIYSELDENHTKQLSKLLTELNQVFITTTNNIDIKASVIEVENNKAYRRNNYGE